MRYAVLITVIEVDDSGKELRAVGQPYTPNASTPFMGDAYCAAQAASEQAKKLIRIQFQATTRWPQPEEK